MYVCVLNFLTVQMLSMWYDKIVVIIFILFSNDGVIKTETHNCLLQVWLYKSLLNLKEVRLKVNMYMCKEFLEGLFVIEGLYEVQVCAILVFNVQLRSVRLNS